MSSLSLEASLRTCKVETGWANKVQSDRFLNPNNMLCPLWNGVDNAGRDICPQSFVTKSAGCNSASDRVVVENHLRPNYTEYVTLSAGGIAGPNTKPSALVRTNGLNQVHNLTGQFGLNTEFGAEIHPRCGIPKNMMAHNNSMARQMQNVQGMQHSQNMMNAMQ